MTRSFGSSCGAQHNSAARLSEGMLGAEEADSRQMQVVVIGAGAVGLGLGSCLLAAGDQVLFVVRSASTRKCLAEEGFARSGIFGERQHSPDSFAIAESIGALRGAQIDCLLVCTKSNATREVARELEAIWQSLEGAPAIVLCQNGWGNAEILAERLPRDRLWNARVITGFRLHQANAVEITVHAEAVRVGCLFSTGASPDDSIIDELCVHTSAGGLPCERSPNIEKDLFAKLLYNCALNPLGALLGVPYGELGRREESRALIEAVVREVFELLAHSEHSTHWSNADAYLDTFYAKLLPRTAGHESSMLQDLQAGRRTEIDALCGAVLRLGQQLGVETPVNRALLELIHAIEARGRRVAY